MNISMKKIYSVLTAGALVFGFLAFMPDAKNVNAQACAAGQTAGNLYGYLETDEIGYIYLSTETWNDDPLGEGHGTTTQQVSVSYDRQAGTFSGRGWSPYAGWVDFGEVNTSNTADEIAEFESPKNDPDSWGNWDPVIDLSGIGYQTDPGGFTGTAFNGGYTYLPDGSQDEFVGAGDISFENVSIIEPVCSQFVSLTLNGASNIYQSSCPVSGTIQINWASENVTNCFVDSSNWNISNNSSVPDEYQSGNNYTFTGSVTDSNPTDTVRIRCTGGNGQTITDSALVQCGSTVTPPTPGTGGTVIPNYTEV
ncbi:MAG: hypothetical protein MRY57_04040 [Candidatus Pacebacteria bacterium]|nr:hypothetical protein [Candidatus Paceibacterota bacterium]